jgi:ubiquinone/menaquinone biosynthesis C-methylase UbiE
MIIEDMLRDAEKSAADLQPWGCYYRLRAAEMRALEPLFSKGKVGRILEIGCGNGFVSALLSRFGDIVVSSDLMNSDLRTHTPGISKASDLFARMGVDNCRPVSCSAESLPFEDASFDIVFSAYVLEHIKDRVGALREVRRVLKDGGRAIFILPSFVERLLYPFYYYAEIAKKAARAALSRISGGAAANADASSGPVKPVSAWERFRKGYPHFPMPDPHGEYPDFFIELINSLPTAWYGLARESGFKVKGSFTIMLFPKMLFSVFNGDAALKFYIKTLRLNEILGRGPVLKNLGQNLCLVMEKHV